MKPRTTLILVVMTILVAGLVALDFQLGTTTEEAAERRRNIVDLNVNAINRMELVRTNETIVAEKDDERWTIVEPLNTPADSSVIRAIFDELEFAQRDRTITKAELDGIDLSDFGLAQPRVTLILSGDQEPVTVRLGSTTPTDDAIYIQVNDHEEVYVVDASLGNRLDQDLSSIRDRKVFDLAATQAVRLQIKSLDRLTVFEKADGRWELSEPFAARASQQAVSNLLADLNMLRVREFLSDDPNDLVTYGLHEPRHEISIWDDQAGESSTLLVGGNPTNDTTVVFAKRKERPAIFTIPQSAIEHATVPLNDLRDNRVFDRQPAEITGIRLQQGVDEIVMTLTNGHWQITAPLEMPAETTEIALFVDQLVGLKIDEFSADVAPDLEPYNLSVPSRIVSLQAAGTNDVSRLLVGGEATTNGLVHVTRTDEPFVYGVTSDLLDWLVVDPWAWRGRAVFPMIPSSITRLELTDDGQPTTVLTRNEEGQWQLGSPSQGVVHVDKLQRLVETLVALQADSFRDPSSEEIVLAPARTIIATHDDKTYTLALESSKQPAAWRATWSDPKLCFTLQPEVAETLMATVVTLVEEPEQRDPPADEVPSPSLTTE